MPCSEQRMWEDVAQSVSTEVLGHVTPENKRVARAAIHGAKLEAVRRAVHSCVRACGTEALYHSNGAYRYAVDVIAQTMVSGVFGESPLTLQERQERDKALRQVVTEIDATSSGLNW